MTIEIGILISVISVSVAVYLGIKNNKRNEKSDVKQDTTAMTTVIVKLENISNGITEIKSELQSVKADQRQDHDELIKVIESAKQAHKRIDGLEGKNGIQ